MLDGRESACQKKPFSDRRHDSQQREGAGVGLGGRGGRQATEKEKNGRDKEREAERNHRGRDAGKKKTNEDVDLRQDDNTLPGWN